MSFIYIALQAAMYGVIIGVFLACLALPIYVLDHLMGKLKNKTISTPSQN